MLLNSSIVTRSGLSGWSHINIGDKSGIVYLPENYRQLKILIKSSNNTDAKPLFLGGGSNLLLGNTSAYNIISDLHLPSFIKSRSNEITVSANYNITRLIMKLRSESIGGLEFLAGIPAHLGGLVKMNAGAYGYSIFDYVKRVQLISLNGKSLILNKKEIDFGYRTTSITGFVTQVTLHLPQKKKVEIDEELRHCLGIRIEKQPLRFPNLGSVFKNPENIYAGELLEKAGFKGKKKNGMAFSQKHANFLINLGSGRFSDAVFLIKQAQNKIKENFNISLVTEIQIINS